MLASVATNERNPRMIDPLDPDLPLLASQAAIELDALIQSRETTLESVLELADALANTLHKKSEHGVPVPLDPPTVSLVGRAFQESNFLTTSAPGVEELLSKASDIARTLAAAHRSDSSRDESIAKVRDFCAALAKCAVAFRRAIHMGSPAHPYRR